MPVILARNRWSLIVRGLVAFALGILTVIWHDMSLGHLILIFFGYAMIDGLLNLAGAVTVAQSHERWLSLLLEALAGIAAALIAVAWPGLPLMGLVYIIVGWGLVTGALEIASAARLRKHVPREWLLSLSGVASIALSVIMVAVPFAATSAVVFWLGVYAFIFGLLLIALGIRLRTLARTIREPLASS
jgi:uncharacterized membrane protein HdeD (DUF308 family)